jgi:hypothetical protein
MSVSDLYRLFDIVVSSSRFPVYLKKMRDAVPKAKKDKKLTCLT